MIEASIDLFLINMFEPKARAFLGIAIIIFIKE